MTSNKFSVRFNNGNYKEIIKRKNDAKGKEIFIVLNSYNLLGDYKSSLEYFLFNKEKLLESDFIKAVKMHIYLLVKNHKNECFIRDEIDKYKNFKYINQEVEEFLESSDIYVSKTFDVENKTVDYKINEILQMLKSDDENAVFLALNDIINDEKYKVINVGALILQILKEKTLMTESYSILLDFLIDSSYEANLLFVKDNKYYSINTLQLRENSLRQLNLIKNSIKKIQNQERDITLGNFVIKMIVKCSYFLTPDYILDLKHISSYIVAAYQIIALIFKNSLVGNKAYQTFLKLSNEEIVKKYKVFLNKTYF